MTGNENNPYARKPDRTGKNAPKPGDADYEVTIADLKKANQDGTPSPAVARNLSDAEVMSGEEDRAGIPMTRAARDATRANDKILDKHEQEAKVGHQTEDGKFIKTPPNTPNV